MQTILKLVSLLFLVGAVVAGCRDTSNLMKSKWHEKFGWKAEEYFDDPKVVELCHAIEANDIKEIDRLITGGANVNAKGKDNMTPLLWAFPEKRLECFTRLLEHGADPNIVIKSDLNTRGGFAAGDSVTHMACRTEFPGYFEAVFTHGGDPNLIRNWSIKGDTPLFSVITGAAPNKKEKVKLLIDKGADLNQMNGTWATPPMQAVGWGGQFDIALMLLEAGADYKIYKPKGNTRLIHTVAIEEQFRPRWNSQQTADFQKLIDWLKARGESIEDAKADIKRWQSWGLSNGEYRRNMDAEVAARKAKETKEKAAAQKPANDEK